MVFLQEAFAGGVGVGTAGFSAGGVVGAVGFGAGVTGFAAG